MIADVIAKQSHRLAQISKSILISAFLFLSLPSCSKPASYTKDILLMDTFVHIEVKGNMSEDLKAIAADKAIARMKALAKSLDYFKGISPSPEMDKVLKKAEEMRKLTKGAFDITLGQGDKIDLGGIAKGFIIDEGIQVLKECGIKKALINAGGDMYCLGEEFKIGIKDPRDTRKIIGKFNVKNKGVATSANYERPGHIIDPRTGMPVEKNQKSATVIADDCMTADALATALYVLDSRGGLSLIESINGVECVIIDEQGELQISSGLRDRLVLLPPPAQR